MVKFSNCVKSNVDTIKTRYFLVAGRSFTKSSSFNTSSMSFVSTMVPRHEIEADRDENSGFPLNLINSFAFSLLRADVPISVSC